ncbi:MAG: nucleotidyl transferase AbiEii/AbiGii toxin family protein [Rubrivivax sp.]|nr:nucleotidyl transferase AbiEii/AbiGii toxin family protein [Rubrivivax sp.]
MNQTYLDTAKALVAAAPHVFFDDTFALKGGTAINLFFRDMPRLSVDLDLVLPDHTLQWAAARKRIDSALAESRKRLQAAGFQVSAPGNDGQETRLQLTRGNILVKVEVNFVMRGTVNPVATLPLTQAASDTLLAEADIPVVSREDVYGGKLVAALDRQHPRDLFDVMQLFGHEGITPGIRRAFVVYLASHNRPIHEVLFPAMRDIRYEYDNNFDGMTAQKVPIKTLLDARERLVAEIHGGLDADEKTFLMSLATAQPDWGKLSIPHLNQLPAIRWKLDNLQKLKDADPKKFQAQSEELQKRMC